MKTQRKTNQGLHLKTRNKRWKWMAGATAATAAGVTASQGSLITVTLCDNFLGTGGVNHLNADLTGDGHPDLTIANVHYTSSLLTVSLNGVRASFYRERSDPVVVARMVLGSRSARYEITLPLMVVIAVLHH